MIGEQRYFFRQGELDERGPWTLREVRTHTFSDGNVDPACFQTRR